MRSILFIGSLLLLTVAANPGGQSQFGPASAQAFNPLKYCVDNCVRNGSASINQCKIDQCASLKSKSQKNKCDRSCNKPEGWLQFCDTSCKKSQVCSSGKEMKACMKKNCDPYKKSDIRRYITCKKEVCGAICK